MLANVLLLCTFLSLFVDGRHTTETSTSNGECDYEHTPSPDWESQCDDKHGHPEQSPINIDTDEAQEDEDRCVVPFKWDVDYDHRGFRVENKGSTLEVIAVSNNEDHEGFDTTTQHIAEFKNIYHGKDDHTRFCLAQFHFHWGTSSYWGSEHTIDGKHYPLEAHFVHFACEDDIETATQAMERYNQCLIDHPNNHEECEEHTLGVIAILFKLSKNKNPAFEEILSDSVLEQIRDKETCAYVDDVKLKKLINNVDKGGYWTYKGSLTTKPCFETVQWFVFKKLSYISEEQLERFRQLEITYPWAEDGVEGNYRPIQQHLGEDVTSCGDDGSGSDSNDDGDSDSSDEHGHSSGDSGEDRNGDNDSDSEENEQSTMVEFQLNGGSEWRAGTNGDNSDQNMYASNGESDSYNLMVSLSPSSLANIWAIAFAILFVNIMLFWCYKRSASSKDQNYGVKYQQTDIEDPDA